MVRICINWTNFEPDERCEIETGVNVEAKISRDAQIPNSRLSIEDTGLVIEFENKASYLLKTGETNHDTWDCRFVIYVI